MDGRFGRSLQSFDSVVQLVNGQRSVGDFQREFAAVRLARFDEGQPALLPFKRAEVGEVDSRFEARHIAVGFGDGVFPDGKGW